MLPMAADSHQALEVPAPISRFYTQLSKEEWRAVWTGDMIMRRCYVITKLVKTEETTHA